MTATLPFVGRDREVALLRARLDSALAGRGGLALISGDAGIGKTTLAELICHEAGERAALVLTGRCYDLTDTAPFAPWIEIFGAYPSDAALPELPEGVARLDSEGDAPGQAALFATAQRFLAAVTAARPVVLLLDDQHWSDDASLDLLRFLARQAASMALLILVTYRTTALTPTHRLARILPLLAREAQALRINLQPLSSDDLWALIRPRYRLEAADEAQLTSYLYNRTEGNPFFASELLQTLEEEQVLRQDAGGWSLGDVGQARTPVLIEQIVGGRLAQLDESDQHLLALAAVVGQTVPFALWSQIAETDRQALLEVVDRAQQARLMTETPDGRGARFIHALTRQVIYDHISPARRRRWHRRAGTVLAGAQTPDPDAVANHFQRSSDPRAAEWLMRAGTRSRRAYSWQAAADRFEAAADVLAATDAEAELQGWLLVQSARMRRYAAPEAGLARLEQARDIAAATGNRGLAGVILWQSGLLYCLQGHIQRGLELLEQGVLALAELTPAEHTQLEAVDPSVSVPPDAFQDRGTLAAWLAVAGRFAEVAPYAQPYLAATMIPDDAATFGDAYHAHARSQAMLGHPEESRLAYARALSTYQEIHHDVHIARTLVNELHIRVMSYAADDRMEIQRIEAEAEAAWARGSDALADSFTGAMRMPRNFIEGRWSDVRAMAQALRAGGTSSLRAEATYWLGLVAHAQGDTDLVWELVHEWIPTGPATPPGDTVFYTAQSLQRLAALASIEAGDLASAQRWLEAGQHWLDWSGAVLGRAELALCWAAYQRAQGNLREARRQAEAALEQASQPRQPLQLIAAHRTLGALATVEGRRDAATTQLNAALVLAERCAAPYEQALTLLASAELALAQDDPASAADLLAAARRLLNPLSARPALARGASLAARSTPAAPQTEPGAVSDHSSSEASPEDQRRLSTLSGREIEVLGLLPAGHTNREIADMLFLSPKTIENHIGRILAKTELPNRAAAAAFAQRVGLA